MRALLDVNFLIALTDPGHSFRQTAIAWLTDHFDHGWASCPLTQNGCVRIVNQPKYPFRVSISEASSTLHDICASPHHVFWPDDISLLNPQLFDHSKIHSPKQLTDLYLLGLAVKNNGRLVTFDHSIPLSAVRGAKAEHLVVL